MIKKLGIFVLSAACCLLIGIGTYYLAILVNPPYVVNSDGSRYGLMPIGQVILALLVSVLMLYPVFRILRKRFEK
jgi:hypothetical protein